METSVDESAESRMRGRRVRRSGAVAGALVVGAGLVVAPAAGPAAAVQAKPSRCPQDPTETITGRKQVFIYDNRRGPTVSPGLTSAIPGHDETVTTTSTITAGGGFDIPIEGLIVKVNAGGSYTVTKTLTKHILGESGVNKFNVPAHLQEGYYGVQYTWKIQSVTGNCQGTITHKGTSRSPHSFGYAMVKG